MLIKKIIEFRRYIHSYNWSVLKQNKNLQGKPSTRLLFTTKVLQRHVPYFSLTGSNHLPQYLNCKILHGVRFCSLDQLCKKFNGNDVFPKPKLNEEQKQEKCLRRKLNSFFSEIR